jgi:protein phosphatase 2C family protein 2/3
VIHPVNKLPVVTNWPNIQIFGIYDGHGGSKCAEYLKDNLHNNIINLPEFPTDIHKAIERGSKICDENFLTMLYDEYKHKFAETKQKMASINRAGSCALMVMTVDEDIFVINVGDSRAIMSKNGGEEFKSLTNDHKPMDPGEYERIVSNGGRIY